MLSRILAAATVCLFLSPVLLLAISLAIGVGPEARP